MLVDKLLKRKTALILLIVSMSLYLAALYFGWFSKTKYESDLSGYEVSCESKRGDSYKVVFRKDAEIYWTSRWVAECSNFISTLTDKEVLVFHSMPSGGRIGKITVEGEVEHESSPYGLSVLVAIFIGVLMFSVLRKDDEQ